MKFIYLIIDFFKTQFMKTKLIFCLFCVGIVVSSLVAIYFYGNYSSDNQVIYGFGDIFKTYQITLASDVEPDSEEVQWLEKQNVREIFFMTRCEWDSQGLSFSRQQERPLYVYCKKDDTYDYLSFVGRAYFTQEEITQGAQVVIMASIDLPSNNTAVGEYIDAKILLNNEEYTLIGAQDSDWNKTLIPYKTFMDHQYKIDRIEILINDLLSEEEANAFQQEIEERFASIPGTEVITPYESQKNYFVDDYNTEILTIFIFGIAFIGFMFLMKYMIDSTSYEYMIYAINGCSKKKLMRLVLIEVLLLTVILFMVSVGVHQLLYDVLFDKINYYQGIVYTVKDYGTVLLCICITALLCTLPFLYSLERKSFIAGKNEYVNK